MASVRKRWSRFLKNRNAQFKKMVKKIGIPW